MKFVKEEVVIFEWFQKKDIPFLNFLLRTKDTKKEK
jgi:hypothetical protein